MNHAASDLGGSDRTSQDGARRDRIRPKRMRLNQAGLDPSRSDRTGQDEAELERMEPDPESIGSDPEIVESDISIYMHLYTYTHRGIHIICMYEHVCIDVCIEA